MAQVIFVEPDGTKHHFNAEEGHSLMEVALRHGIDAIRADCGGSCSCATCHVLVDTAWGDRLPAMEETEELMLEFVEGRDESSRLSCQIQISADLDGLTVTLPQQ